MKKDENTAGPAVRIMVAIMGSRVLGLVRDVVLNSVFGAGMALDAFWTAFRIPNLLRDLFAEGALSAAFTTTFSKKLATDGKEAAFRLANLMFTSMALILAVVCVIGMIFSDQIVGVIGGGFADTPGKLELTAELVRILFPFILFVSLAAIYMGLLNSLGSFGLPASASTVFNATSIICGLGLGWWVDPEFGPDAIYGFAWGTVLGGIAQLLIQMPRAHAFGLRLQLLWDWRDPDLRKVYMLALPAVVGVAAVQVNVLVNTWWASHMGEGAVTYFNNAFRLMQLPIGMFGVAISMVVLPHVSRSVVGENMHLFRSKVVEGIKLALFLTVPASIGLCVLAEPIIGLIFQHGRFGAVDVLQTARLLQFFTIGLAGYACIKVMAPTFYALDMPKVPVMISVRAIFLNLVITLVLIKGLGFGLMALPLSISLVALLNLFQLAFALSRRLGSLTTGTDFPGFFLKLILMALVLAAFAWSAARGVAALAPDGFAGNLLMLVVVIPLSMGIWFGIAWKLGLDEMKAVGDVFARLSRRRS